MRPLDTCRPNMWTCTGWMRESTKITAALIATVAIQATKSRRRFKVWRSVTAEKVPRLPLYATHPLALCRPPPHLERVNPPDPITRLNAALEGRYRIESELGEGGMATVVGSRIRGANEIAAV